MVTFLVKLTQSESSFTLPGIDGTMICTLIKFMYVCMYVLLVGNNVLMILYLYDLVFDKIWYCTLVEVSNENNLMDDWDVYLICRGPRGTFHG